MDDGSVKVSAEVKTVYNLTHQGNHYVVTADNTYVTIALDAQRDAWNCVLPRKIFQKVAELLIENSKPSRLPNYPRGDE